ncbi:porin [Thauera sinica]|uniref:Porin n=1 Tax=Thauera sinica TaxID=2665146 RepID=A0ABW1AY47_9RHOO|nr:porin [Thauera sp. K11]
MQKKTNRFVPLVAGGVLGAAMLPAAAQSNVTIYGVVDAAMTRTTGGGYNQTAMDGRGILQGSRLGFRGTEDLGNGLKALFQLEQGLNVDTGTAPPGAPAGESWAFQRQAWVGLGGAWGTLGLGRQYAPGYATARFDILEGSGLYSARGWLTSVGGYTINPGSPARWSNSVRYMSPDLSGFSFEGIYSNYNNEDPARTRHPSGDDRWAMGFGYAKGPGEIGVVYHNVGVGAGVEDTREFFIGGSWDFGFLKAMATWQRKDAEVRSGDNRLWSVGVVVPVLTSSAFHLGYASLDVKGRDNDSNSLSTGFVHNLSKRTALYAILNRMHHDDLAPNLSGIEQPIQPGETASTWALGVRHKF